ncbi:MAG: SagB/ThcOx family dehydrogenase [Candidatus Brocadiia bacterium]
MKRAVPMALLFLLALTFWIECTTGGKKMAEAVDLPEPKSKGKVSLEETLAGRRSRRHFREKSIALGDLSQVLWAAQGITGAQHKKRTCPSAGATYPLELFVVVGNGGVKGLDAGVYHYEPGSHSLKKGFDQDVREKLARAALRQQFIGQAPVNIVIAADYSRTTGRYGDRGHRYVHMEVGHAGENIYLQAESLGLGTVAVGAFEDDDVGEVVRLPDKLAPLYIMPLGYPTDRSR